MIATLEERGRMAYSEEATKIMRRIVEGSNIPLVKGVIIASMRISGLGISILSDSVVQTIAAAIQRQEGYYPGSLAYRNNNPGNLIYAGQTGAVVGDGGFAKFPTYQDGLNALYNQIQLYASRGMTIQDMMNVYAPAGDGGNDPTGYAETIAAAVGATPDTPLTSLDSLQPVDPSAFVPTLDPTSAGFTSGGLLMAAGAGLLGILLLSRA
jgi:hypothetical protein